MKQPVPLLLRFDLIRDHPDDLTALLALKSTAADVLWSGYRDAPDPALFADWYAGQTFVRVLPLDSSAYLDKGFLPATACNDTNRAEIFVFGHAEQVVVCARFDNLGKGASGAALQCMNIMLGVDEATGLYV